MPEIRTSSVTDTPVLAFDLSGWMQVEIAGADRQSFLHSFCTNDISRLRAGEGCEAFIPSVKGRILGHVLILACDATLHLLSVPAAGELLVPHLRKYLLGVDAEIVDRSRSLGLLCVCGVDAEETLRRHLGSESFPPSVGANQTLDWEGAPLLIGRGDMTVLPTWLLSGDRASVAALQRRLTEEASPALRIEAGAPELFEALRIEAGFPWPGRDVSEENIAQEAGRTDRAISFTKGCYLGQEPIARLDALGHTNKELRGLVIDGSDVPPGSPVVSEEKEVGRVTSAVFVPRLGKTLALAIIRSRRTAPGTELAVSANGQTRRGLVYWPRWDRQSPGVSDLGE